jgi:hypothetical protein
MLDTHQLRFLGIQTLPEYYPDYHDECQKLDQDAQGHNIYDRGVQLSCQLEPFLLGQARQPSLKQKSALKGADRLWLPETQSGMAFNPGCMVSFLPFLLTL